MGNLYTFWRCYYKTRQFHLLYWRDCGCTILTPPIVWREFHILCTCFGLSHTHTHTQLLDCLGHMFKSSVAVSNPPTPTFLNRRMLVRLSHRQLSFGKGVMCCFTICRLADCWSIFFFNPADHVPFLDTNIKKKLLWLTTWSGRRIVNKSLTLVYQLCSNWP